MGVESGTSCQPLAVSPVAVVVASSVPAAVQRLTECVPVLRVALKKRMAVMVPGWSERNFTPSSTELASLPPRGLLGAAVAGKSEQGHAPPMGALVGVAVATGVGEAAAVGVAEALGDGRAVAVPVGVGAGDPSGRNTGSTQ